MPPVMERPGDTGGDENRPGDDRVLGHSIQVQNRDAAQDKPTAMIQSMSGNNLKYQSNHALPMTIRVMGKPASLMNPPRQTLDPEIAVSLTGPIKKYRSS